MICNQCGMQILQYSLYCSFCDPEIIYDKDTTIINQNNLKELAKYFWNLAKVYLPKKIKFLLIAESPPKNPKNYFYYIKEDQGNYMFFQNVMLAVSNIKYSGDIKIKKELLNKFYEKGLFLTDAKVIPVENDAKQEIIDSIPNLFERLKQFMLNGYIDSKTRIILIKNLVCELLKNPLEENKNIIFDKSTGVQCVPFPWFFTDPNCYEKLRNILNNKKEQR